MSGANPNPSEPITAFELIIQLYLIITFALISSIFFYKKKQTLEIVDKNKEMHWGFPGSKPPAPMMRNV